jgi:L-threonylcarbamoyladenylate synthase
MSVKMETRVLTLDPRAPSQDLLAEAGAVLRAGGLVAVPTETVYGIAADAGNAAALARLRLAKGRPEDKPLPVMVSGPAQMSRLAREVPAAAMALAERFWPGPLTLVLWADDGVSDGVGAGTRTVGLRCPDHPVALGLLRAAGCPLALTSANLSGQPPATDAVGVLATLGGRVEMLLDAGPASLREPSTVLDLTDCPARVLRHGAVTEQALREVVDLP